jgi:hypothetical protein
MFFLPFVINNINNKIKQGHNKLILMLKKNIIGKGIKSATSTSNTINITANKKNRNEKGTRAVPLGSNPHSKEDPFSRS